MFLYGFASFYVYVLFMALKDKLKGEKAELGALVFYMNYGLSMIALQFPLTLVVLDFITFRTENKIEKTKSSNETKVRFNICMWLKI